MIGISLGVTGGGFAPSPYAIGGLPAQFVYDPVRSRFRVDGRAVTAAVAMPTARASTGTYVNAEGQLVTAAINAPRFPHHVWNGSAWENVGQLLESEARTNLVPLSIPAAPGWSAAGTTLTPNSISSPAGIVDATKLVATTANAEHYLEETFAVTSGTQYTFSVFLKKLGYSNVAFRITAPGFVDNAFVNVNMDNGTVASGTGTIDSLGVQDFGNGWLRVHMVRTANSNNTALLRIQPNTTAAYVGDDASGAYVWGAQAEQGATPSSYIATSGAAVTRAAETLVAPADNLPSPPVEYIGDELVTNGTFDDGLTNVTDASSGASSVTVAGGVLTFNVVGGDNARAQIPFSVEAGKVYEVSTVGTLPSFAIGTTAGGTTILAYANAAVRSFVATFTGTYWFNTATGGATGLTLETVSVREIKEPAVTIHVKGRVTYADQGTYGTAVFYDWLGDTSNRLILNLDTDSALTGRITAQQRVSGIIDYGISASELTPGVQVPFSVAVRHTSTAIQSANDGSAGAADTTPLGLADLSSAPLKIGPTFMGTIELVRIVLGDVGESGIEGATS